jgi:hypothetical protein
VVDPSGVPVEGARVLLDGAPVGTTSTGGSLRVGPLASGVTMLRIEGDNLIAVDHGVELTTGTRDVTETVRYQDGTVEVRVRGPEGAVPDAVVTFDGPRDEPFAKPGAASVRRVLGPGTWTIVVSSKDFGVQERQLVLLRGDGALHVVDVVLAPLSGGLAKLELRVVDPDGTAVEGAAITVDAVEYGRSVNGGMRFGQLDVGVRQVTVTPAAGQPFQPAGRSLKLLEGENDAEVRLDWAEYAVRVRATSGGKAAPDAVVRLVSDRQTLPALPVDAKGERVVATGAGLWMALVSSPVGVAQEDFEVKTKGLTTVAVEIRPVAADKTDLVVRVVGPDHKPVDDPKVTVDGIKAGEGEAGGHVVARGLAPHEAVVEVSAPDYEPSGPLKVLLRPGETEQLTVELPWVP